MKKTIIAIGIAWISVVLAGCPPAAKKQKKFPPLFVFSSTLDTEKEPSFLLTGDIDGDNKLDLVVTNSGSNSISLYKGKGDGTFADQVLIKAGEDPICIVLADFNGDKSLDIAELNYADQTILIYLNTGAGKFFRTQQVLKPGKIPINLTSGDFNKDGLSDLAVSMRYHKVVVFLAKRNGIFSKPKSIPVRGQPTGLVTGDYNHDKNKDIAVALAGSGNVGVEILWGEGDGTFKPSKLYKGGKQPLTITNIDVDGDGYLDLVTSSNSFHALTVVMNNHDGTFRALRDFASGEFPKFAVASDFSGDGIPDIAVSNSTNDTISVSLGRGDGTFTYPPIYHRVEEYPQGIAVGDFNGDGLEDLAVACRDKSLISILLKRNIVVPSPAA